MSEYCFYTWHIYGSILAFCQVQCFHADRECYLTILYVISAFTSHLLLNLAVQGRCLYNSTILVILTKR